jgi:hypothetical protein
VIRWGKKLGIPHPKIEHINDRLHLRSQLGKAFFYQLIFVNYIHFILSFFTYYKDLIRVIYLTPKDGKKLLPNHSVRLTMFKEILVSVLLNSVSLNIKNINTKKITITISLYLGFFSYKNKKYGQFFCAVHTFTGKIFATPLRNVKTKSLIEAIQLMTKVTI